MIEKKLKKNNILAQMWPNSNDRKHIAMYVNTETYNIIMAAASKANKTVSLFLVEKLMKVLNKK